MIHLAFYRGGTTWLDFAIRMATRSKYSHCEVLFTDNYWASSSYDMRGVYCRQYIPIDTWDYIAVKLPYGAEAVRYYCESLVGAPYDYYGAVRFVLPVVPERLDSWFCSELCACVLVLGGVKLKQRPAWYSPGRLAKELVSCGLSVLPRL